MWRYFRLYQAFLKTGAMAEFEHRGNFFLSAIISFAWSLLYVFIYVFIFKHIDQVGDWNYARSLVLAATYLIVSALNKFLFTKNFKEIAYLVYSGDLDLILAKPLSSQFYISLKRFYLMPFIRFILGWFVLALVIIKTGMEVKFLFLINYLLLIMLAVFISYSLWFMSCCSVFWLGNIENIYELFNPILRMTAFPFDLLPHVLKGLFFFVIPLIFIATIPAKSFFGLVSWPVTLYATFIALFLLFLSNKLWHYALTFYVSASS